MINANDIQSMINDKDKRKKHIFEEILKNCDTRIRQQIVHNEVCMVFRIPSFMPGYPLYSHSEAVDYIYKKLIRQGFYVRMVDAETIYISWIPKKKKKVKKKSILDEIKEKAKKISSDK